MLALTGVLAGIFSVYKDRSKLTKELFAGKVGRTPDPEIVVDAELAIVARGAAVEDGAGIVVGRVFATVVGGRVVGGRVVGGRVAGGRVAGGRVVVTLFLVGAALLERRFVVGVLADATVVVEPNRNEPTTATIATTRTRDG
jgi:hypothetical protein